MMPESEKPLFEVYFATGILRIVRHRTFLSVRGRGQLLAASGWLLDDGVRVTFRGH